MNNLFTQMIVCPICGFDYVHFNEPVYKKSGDESGVAWEGRGDAIVIPMWCESEHEWDLVIGFHKGNTFIHNKNRRGNYSVEIKTR